MQVIYYMDAEIRSQEEARAQELAKPQVVASLASAAGGKVKKKPGRAAERGRGSALKMENPDGWNDVANGGDGPKPLVQKAGALIHSRRKKQKKNSQAGTSALEEIPRQPFPQLGLPEASCS